VPTSKQKQAVKDAAGPTAQEKLVKALNHPIRVKALTILAERVASPTEIADEIDVPLSHVSYHVRVLDELGMIEIVEEEPVRGAVKHFYKSVQRPYLLEEMEQLDPHVRTGFALYAFEALIKDASESLSTGTFIARPEYHFSRTPLQLDPQGFARVAQIQEEALEAIFEEEAASAGRMCESGEDAVRTVAAMFTFEMPEKTKKRTKA
jgi:DNA-binding transcriptional ArsR family regulator